MFPLVSSCLIPGLKDLCICKVARPCRACDSLPWGSWLPLHQVSTTAGKFNVFRSYFTMHLKCREVHQSLDTTWMFAWRLRLSDLNDLNGSTAYPKLEPTVQQFKRIQKNVKVCRFLVLNHGTGASTVQWARLTLPLKPPSALRAISAWPLTKEQCTTGCLYIRSTSTHWLIQSQVVPKVYFTKTSPIDLRCVLKSLAKFLVNQRTAFTQQSCSLNTIVEQATPGLKSQLACCWISFLGNFT